MLSRFHLVPERNGLTDRQTDGQTDLLYQKCYRTVECQQVEGSRFQVDAWMEQQQKKRDGPVRCVCEERRASEHRNSAESEVVHGSVPTR